MSESAWSFAETSGHLAGTDLTGWRVEATDGHIGTVDKHSDEVGAAYLVVDTGVWIFGKEVLLPASAVTRVDRVAHTVHVDRTKDQIKAAPEGEARIGVRTCADVVLALGEVEQHASETPQFRAGAAAAYQWATSRTERAPITGADAGGTPDLPLLTAEVDAILVQLGDPAIAEGTQAYLRGAHEALAWICGQRDRAA